MKKIFYAVLLGLSILMVSCETMEPATSAQVKTLSVDSITSISAILNGSVGIDISVYDRIEFGMMVSKDLDEMNNRDGMIFRAEKLVGKNFEVDLNFLEPDTKYYYCSYLILNGLQYEYGAIKSFRTLTLSGEDLSSTLNSTKWESQVQYTSVGLNFSEEANIVTVVLSGYATGEAKATYRLVDNVFVFMVAEVMGDTDNQLHVGDTAVGILEDEKLLISMELYGEEREVLFRKVE